MFIVTNRVVNEGSKSPLGVFGDRPEAGPNELRLAGASRRGDT